MQKIRINDLRKITADHTHIHVIYEWLNAE